MKAKPHINRRGFLQTTAAAAGGLVVGIALPSGRGRAFAAPTDANAFSPNAFVRIGPDDSVTVIANHCEMGQGVHTALAMLVAEELDADWSKVRIEDAPVAKVYESPVLHVQGTGSSSSTWSEWERLRTAGATARAMLVAAAAERWGVPGGQCRTEKGQVIHEASGRRLSYGSLAAAAARRDAPKAVALKDPSQFLLIGRPMKRLDTPAKVNGSARFGIDIERPGMLVALVARPPIFGGTLRRFDAARAMAIPGVRHVVAIDSGVAVVADGFWPARLGRDALEVAWDEGATPPLDSAAQAEEYARMAGGPGAVARNQGDAAAALGGAASRLEAVYQLPYLAHAPMEPLNCVADARADRCTVWTGTQLQSPDRAAAARAASLAPEKVELTTTLLGGSFGRRASLDGHFVREAVQISRVVQAPVKTIWTREDDIRGGYYRTDSHHAIAAGLDPSGQPVAWQHRIVSQSFVTGTPLAAALVRNGVDHFAVEGAVDLPYAIAHVRVDWHEAPKRVPTLWWRSVGHSGNAFVVESFIDELAAAAKRDPFEYRRALLGGQPRHLRVLERVAERAGWASRPPSGRGRGIAVHASFGSFVAQVAEVSISKAGAVRVHRVVCAIDCGPVVNPDTVRAQIEGGVVYALGAVLQGRITLAGGRVVQRNFHDYPVPRMNEVPEVETHIIESSDRMGGVGEVAVPPLAPAVANAIFALTGKRVRHLPVRPADLT